jgi:hypothetical protein
MKTSHSLRFVILGAAALIAHLAFAQNRAEPKPDYVSGELLIKFVPGAPVTAILDARRGVGASVCMKKSTRF